MLILCFFFIAEKMKNRKIINTWNFSVFLMTPEIQLATSCKYKSLPQVKTFVCPSGQPE